ncbi:H-NS family nucleoid-associated regulatory protein [Massilia sp.]
MSQSWNGLGRMPLWAKAWLANGRQLDELRK